jgi:4-hydroxy-2-oxoheptanedioate aldolase
MRSLKQRIEQRGFATNTYCTIPAAFLAEIAAHEGFDAVTLDLQHGLIDYDTAVPMVASLAARQVVPMVRTPALDEAAVMKLLDAGVLGIICAAIESREQAERLVSACRYPPRGTRSFGPVRAGLIYDDYVACADGLVTVLAMIETAAGVRNLDAILATPGLDGVYIGPMDLAMSMGKPSIVMGEFASEVEWAIESILRRCRDKGMICGMLGSDGRQAAGLIRRGFNFVTLSNEVRALQQKYREWTSELDRHLAE